MVVEPVDGPAEVAEPSQCVAQRGPGRVADGHVVETGRPRGRRRAALRLPGVEAEGVVVAAGGDEQSAVALDDDVETQDSDVERLDLLQV